MSWKAKRFQKRLMSKHHLRPRCRDFSPDSDDNLLKLWRDRHDAWHLLFGVRTLDEIIAVLTRIKSMKGYWYD